MPQSLTQEQTQEQKLVQQQRITQQQLLNVKLLGMSLAELEQNVNAEINDNPALERVTDDEHAESYDEPEETYDDGDYETSMEREERRDELERALESMESDDEPVEKENSYGQEGIGQGDIIYGETLSFRDKLAEQTGELELSDRERAVMEYLIGSLDNDGFLRKETDVLVEEMAIYEYIDTTHEEVEWLLSELQKFDPPGLGARSLQECLRIQIERMGEGRLKTCMLKVVDNYFNAFKRMRWDKIQDALKLNDVQMATLKREFRRLNPKPGAAMGESIGRSIQQITPDFTIYTTDDGRITFDINNGNLPSLAISDTFAEMLESAKKQPDRKMSKSDKEAMVYVKRKVEQANWYIDAIRQRRITMEKTMRAIISRQRKFFLTGEESDLRPMILKDVAEATGLDLSTVSRVCNEKYAHTQWGTFPLRYFFTDNFATEEGGELSTRKVQSALKEVIDKEDKRSPLSDEALVEEMRKRGFNIARRTVAKYRDRMGIPSSKMRADR